MLKFSRAHLEQMAKDMRDFIARQPDAPMFAEYPNPAKEFTIHGTVDAIAITHPTLQTVFLTTGSD
jgi:hypothetical protein